MPELTFKAGFNEATQDFDLQINEVQLVKEAVADHRELTHRNDLGQHPMSAVTGLEETLSSIQQDKHFMHVQSSASSAWVIEHTLDKMPSVSVVDSGGSIVVGEIQYVSPNKIVVAFTGAFSGKAYLN